MRMLAIIGGVAVLLVVFLVVLMLADRDQAAPLPVPSAGTDADSPGRKPAWLGPAERSVPPGRTFPAPESTTTEPVEQTSDATVMRFGTEFEAKWKQDRDRLGLLRHGEMENLWFSGRRPLGNPESIARLEQILRDFPESNRAGCAAYELGNHYLNSHGLDLEARRKKSEDFWRQAIERYDGSLCEFNAHPAARSMLSLATRIYQYTDRAAAERMARDIIKRFPGETDALGQPLADSAQRLLDQLKEGR